MAEIVEKLLADVSEEGSHDHITLNTWFDRLMKALTVWLPLLVSGTLFLGELTGEFQNVYCYPPSSFTVPQANFLNAFCRENLPKDHIWYPLFPYTVPLIALVMNSPHFLWKVTVGAKIKSHITFISNQIENTFSLYLKFVDLKTGDINVDNEDDQWDEKKRVAEQQMKESAKRLTDFVNYLNRTNKLRKRQILKLGGLLVFAIGCSGYLIWFATRFQKDHSFVCNANVVSSINETEADAHIESSCKIIGIKHLYHVSFLLSACGVAASILPLIFICKICCKNYTFLGNVLMSLDRLAKNDTDDKGEAFTKSSAFSDFSIIGRLCGENRHLFPSLNMIMQMSNEIKRASKDITQGKANRICSCCFPPGDNDPDDTSELLNHRTGSVAESDEAVTPSQPSSGGPSSSFPTVHTEDEDLSGDGTPLTTLKGNHDTDENADQSAAGHEAASTDDVKLTEVVTDPQPSSGGSSSSKQSLTAGDEITQEGATGDDQGLAEGTGSIN